MLLGAHQGGYVTTRFLEGCLEDSLKTGLLRRRLVRASVGTGVGGFLEGGGGRRLAGA